MAIEIFYTGTDNGDGSLGVDFFYEQECIDLLEEAFPETYRGEGGNSFIVDGSVTFLSSLDIMNLEETKAYIEENKEYML